MPGRNAYETVHAIALEQYGVFSVEQARAAGVKTTALVMMVRRGKLEVLAYGLYRDLGTAESRLSPYMMAVLWPRGATGVLSHETALALMELSDANPAKIHLTLPKKHRPRRPPLPGVELHFADLDDTAVGSVEGLPVTSAARTIRDCAEANIGPALLRQALRDGRQKGWLSPAEVEALTAELTAAGRL